MAFLDENGVAQLWAAVKDRLAGAFDNVEFDIAEQAANLVSGDSIATAFGKLAKNYSSILTSISDLNTSLGNRITEVNTNLTNQINTKLNKSDVLVNYTTTTTGKALDASLGPAIKNKMDLADSLNTRVGSLETTNTGMNTWNSWTPKVYDMDTFIRNWDNGRWIQIGDVKIAYMLQNNQSLASINTMLQIKNVPMTQVIGGGIYIGHMASQGASMTVQGAANSIFFRPNFVSSQVSGDPSMPGVVSFWCFGW